MSSNSTCHPFAMLDRCQSRRIASVPVGDNLQMLMARKTEAPPYEDLINYPRAKDKDEIRCVMCGFPPGMTCAIPRQNKDVCKVRDCPSHAILFVTLYVFFYNFIVFFFLFLKFNRNVIKVLGFILSLMYILNGVKDVKNSFGWDVSLKNLTQQSVIAVGRGVVKVIY